MLYLGENGFISYIAQNVKKRDLKSKRVKCLNMFWCSHLSIHCEIYLDIIESIPVLFLRIAAIATLVYSLWCAGCLKIKAANLFVVFILKIKHYFTKLLNRQWLEPLWKISDDSLWDINSGYWKETAQLNTRAARDKIECL